MERRAVLKYMSAWGASAALPPALRPALAGSNLIAFNQTGYTQQSEKVASIQMEVGRDESFQIISEEGGHSVFEGRLTHSFTDSASGDAVSLADFSSVTASGKYGLVAQGVRSQPFQIGNEVYAHPLMLCMRAFYGQRCGCAV